MNTRVFIAVVITLGVTFGLYYFETHEGVMTFENYSSSTTATTSQLDSVSGDERITTIHSFDECIAAGNAPLKDAPDKCLTKDGHIYIQGVVE